MDKIKVRYQNPIFRRKLQEARRYRRTVRQIPETFLGIFLARIGLGSWKAKIYIILIIVLSAYFIYGKHFLTIKNIIIEGAEAQYQDDILNTVKQYISKNLLWPQNNLFLLSKVKLKNHLEEKNLFVSSIEMLQKDFPSTLYIKIKPRFSEFLLKSGEASYIISNDGIVQKQLTLEDLIATNSPPSTLIPIYDLENKQFLNQQPISGKEYFNNLQQVLRLTQERLSTNINEIKLENFNNSEIEAKTQAGYWLKLDLNSDLPKVFAQTELLLKQLPEGKIKSVKYLDMRIKDRGYICALGMPCAIDSVKIENTSTTTIQ